MKNSLFTLKKSLFKYKKRFIKKRMRLFQENPRAWRRYKKRLRYWRTLDLMKAWRKKRELRAAKYAKAYTLNT